MVISKIVFGFSLIKPFLYASTLKNISNNSGFFSIITLSDSSPKSDILKSLAESYSEPNPIILIS